MSDPPFPFLHFNSHSCFKFTNKQWTWETLATPPSASIKAEPNEKQIFFFGTSLLVLIEACLMITIRTTRVGPATTLALAWEMSMGMGVPAQVRAQHSVMQIASLWRGWETYHPIHNETLPMKHSAYSSLHLCSSTWVMGSRHSKQNDSVSLTTHSIALGPSQYIFLILSSSSIPRQTIQNLLPLP